MNIRWRRTVSAVILASATAVGGLLSSGPAVAQTVTSGSFTMTSDPGDYIGQGQSYAYSTQAGDTLSVFGNNENRVVSVSISGANGDWWNLDLAAPSDQALAPGVYADATRYPFNAASQPGLSVSGNGRGCNTLTGSFTINEVTFGPHGYVQKLDATFEQHCEGWDPALRGQIRIDNPEPPAPLELGLAVADTGTASALNGKATVHGTVTCNTATPVSVTGNVTQVVRDTLATGSFSTSVSCTPGESVPWEAAATPNGSVPFRRGDAEVETRAAAQDPVYGNNVTAETTTVVRLRRA